MHVDLPELTLLPKRKEQNRLCLVSFIEKQPDGGLCWASLCGCTAAKGRPDQDGITGMSSSKTASVSSDTDLSRQG